MIKGGLGRPRPQREADSEVSPGLGRRADQNEGKMFYAGGKDGRVWAANARGVDEAYLQIGKLAFGYAGDDPGEVDLDWLAEIDCKKGRAVELPTGSE